MTDLKKLDLCELRKMLPLHWLKEFERRTGLTASYADKVLRGTRKKDWDEVKRRIIRTLYYIVLDEREKNNKLEWYEKRSNTVD